MTTSGDFIGHRKKVQLVRKTKKGNGDPFAETSLTYFILENISRASDLIGEARILSVFDTLSTTF